MHLESLKSNLGSNDVSLLYRLLSLIPQLLLLTKFAGGARIKFQLISLLVVFGLLLFNTGPSYARHQSSSIDQTNNHNVTENVIDCFENNASNIENQFITEIAQNLNNISAIQNGIPFNKNHTELVESSIG